VVRHREHVGPHYRFIVAVLLPLTKALWRVEWRHAERIPTSGPAILAFNHVSYADPIFVGRLVWDHGRVPRFLAKASLFTMPFVGWLMRNAGQIPVYRGTADASEALRGGAEALDRGEIAMFYPEGTVTRDPQFWPMEPHTGIARLVLLRPEVPVIPVGHWGAQQWLDVYGRRFRPFSRPRLIASVGPVVDLSAYSGKPPTHEVLHAMTDTIMRAVRDEVAAIRQVPAPTQFYPRPVGAGVRASDAKPGRPRRSA